MKVAIFVGNPQGIYSGGRYLSLIMAYAMARAGLGVTYVTDYLPVFDLDFAGYERRFPIAKAVHPDFAVDIGPQDWVVVIPSGGITTTVYDAALGCAEKWGSRVALLSFESPNWFNALSPFKRNPLAWEAWRAAVTRGGLVLTIAREGIGPAERFYGQPEAGTSLFFDHWHPPINDLVADAVAIPAEREAVVCFMRTQDPHKGAMDLLRLDAACLAGRTLSVVFGRPVEPDYLAALHRHFSHAGVTIDVQERISDAEKFALLARSRLLLFPSYFEGFGYPVVEAAHMGVPSVAYDLPVLRETVGDAADYVAPGDLTAFSEAVTRGLGRALGDPVRAALRIRPNTLSAGERARDLFTAFYGRVRPISLVEAPRPRRLPPASQGLADGRLRGAWERARRPRALISVAAVLSQGAIEVTGKTDATAEDAVLRVTFPGADIPELPLAGATGAGPDRSFRITGSLSPSSGTDASLCEVALLEGGRVVARTFPRPRADPSFLFGGGARATGWGDHAGRLRSALIIADWSELTGHSSRAFAVADLAASLGQVGAETILFLRVPGRNTFAYLDEIETDLLARVGRVEAVGPDADPMNYAARLGARMPLIVAGPAPLFPLPEDEVALEIEAGRGSRWDAPLLVGEAGVVSSRRTLVTFHPDHSAISRSEMARRFRRSVLLAGGAADDAAARDEVRRFVTETLRRLNARTGPGRLVIHRTLAERIRSPVFLSGEEIGPGWTVVVEGMAGIRREIRDAGIAVVVDAGSRGDDPILSVLAVAAGQPVLRADGGGDLVDQIVAAWSKEPARRGAPVLLPALAGRWPDMAPDGATRLRGPLDALLSGTAPPSRGGPPRLAIGEAISLASPVRGADRFLLTGWSEMSPEGCEVPTDGAMLAFSVTELPETDVTLGLLVRSHAPDGAPLQLQLRFNDRPLGRIEVPAGLSSSELTVPLSAWQRGAIQTLFCKGSERIAATETCRPILAAIAFTADTKAADWSSVDPDRPVVVPTRADVAPTTYPLRIGLHDGSDTLARLTVGWSHPEADGTWSCAPVAGLLVDERIGAEPIIVRISGRTLVSGSYPEQRIRVEAATGTVGAFTVGTNEAVDLLALVPPHRTASSLDAFEFHFPDAVSPMALGYNADARQLGMFVRDVTLDLPAGAAIPATIPLPGAGLHTVRFDAIPSPYAAIRLAGEGPLPELTVDMGAIRSTFHARRAGQAWELWCAVPTGAVLEGRLQPQPGQVGDAEDLRITGAEAWPVLRSAGDASVSAVELRLQRTGPAAGAASGEQAAMVSS